MDVWSYHYHTCDELQFWSAQWINIINIMVVGECWWREAWRWCSLLQRWSCSAHWSEASAIYVAMVTPGVQRMNSMKLVSPSQDILSSEHLLTSLRVFGGRNRLLTRYLHPLFQGKYCDCHLCPHTICFPLKTAICLETIELQTLKASLPTGGTHALLFTPVYRWQRAS